MPLAVALLIEPSTGLPNGEIRCFAFRGLALRARQRRAYQRAMYRPVVLGEWRLVRLAGRIHGGGIGKGIGRVVGPCHGSAVRNVGGRCRSIAVDGRRDGQRSRRSVRQRRLVPLLAAGRRHSGLLVLVIRVTGRAACLLDLVFDHGDDRMIGDAALARTVVVENVTEPKPALLHELPRIDSFQVG
jgi:hypothetical protein